MKIRLRRNSIRLRLTEPEVQQLCLAGVVEETLDIAVGLELVYCLRAASPQDRIEVRTDGLRLDVICPEPEVRAWAQSEAVGLYARQQGAAMELEVAVEKDFRCLHKDPASEPGAYRNPGEPLETGA